MSLKPLLEVDTKEEDWSALNCFSIDTGTLTVDDITAENITAQNIFANNIYGRLSTVSGVTTGANVTITSGTGTLSSVQSLGSYWIANATTNPFHTFSASFLFDTNVTAPVVGTVSTFIFDVTIPFSASMAYPVAVGALMPGGSSAVLVDTSGAEREVASCEIVRKSATQVTVYCTVNKDISAAPTFARSIRCSFSIQYQIAP